MLYEVITRGMGVLQPLNVLLKQFEHKFVYLEDMQKLFFEQLYQQERVITSYSIHYTKLYDTSSISCMLKRFRTA